MRNHAGPAEGLGAGDFHVGRLSSDGWEVGHAEASVPKEDKSSERREPSITVKIGLRNHPTILGG